MPGTIRGTDEAVTAEVVLVTGTTLSGPAMTAAPGRTCARRLRGAAAEAPGSSQARLSGLSASGRCHVLTRLDRRPFARRFAAALRDSAPSAAPGLGRGRWRWALSTRRFPERWVRDRPVSQSARLSAGLGPPASI